MWFILVVFAIIIIIFVVLPILAVKSGIDAIKKSNEKAEKKRRKESDKEHRKNLLFSINVNLGKVLVDIGNKISKVEGYNDNLELIGINIESHDLLKQRFPNEYKYAIWRRDFISKLVIPNTESWMTIFSLTWKTVRLLEERDKLMKDGLQNTQTDAVLKLSDKALAGLYYISSHCKSSDLYDQIKNDINHAQKKISDLSDPLEIQSLQTLIETHNKRLKQQQDIINTLRIVEGEVETLKATLNLIIERLESTISIYHLEEASFPTLVDSSLFELQLPLLDQIFLQEIRGSSSIK